MTTQDHSISAGKSPCLLTIQAVEYWEILSTVSIRRLWSLRFSRDSQLARSSIAGWVRTLRDCKRVRAYRNW